MYCGKSLWALHVCANVCVGSDYVNMNVGVLPGCLYCLSLNVLTNLYGQSKNLQLRQRSLGLYYKNKAMTAWWFQIKKANIICFLHA